MQPGEVLAILGRNGMGKTTLIRTIVGFTPPREGRVRYKDTEITAWPPFRMVELGMALVPQGRRVFPSLSVRENLEVARRRRRAMEPRAGVCSVSAAARAGGQPRQQALGRRAADAGDRTGAHVATPDLLLMDEPTEGLAPLLVREVGRVIAELKRSGLSILLVEQNLALALSVADRVHVLSRGQIVHTGTPAELMANDDVKSRYLGVA